MTPAPITPALLRRAGEALYGPMSFTPGKRKLRDDCNLITNFLATRANFCPPDSWSVREFGKREDPGDTQEEFDRRVEFSWNEYNCKFREGAD